MRCDCGGCSGTATFRVNRGDTRLEVCDDCAEFLVNHGWVLVTTAD